MVTWSDTLLMDLRSFSCIACFGHIFGSDAFLSGAHGNCSSFFLLAICSHSVICRAGLSLLACSFISCLLDLDLFTSCLLDLQSTCEDLLLILHGTYGDWVTRAILSSIALLLLRLAN